jgi:hypothetical protein
MSKPWNLGRPRSQFSINAYLSLTSAILHWCN